MHNNYFLSSHVIYPPVTVSIHPVLVMSTESKTAVKAAS